MEPALYERVIALKDALAADPRLLRLREVEKALNDDAVVKDFVEKKNAAEDEYVRCREVCRDDDVRLASSQKSLYIAKKALDELPLVRAYYHAYSAVRELINYLNEQLFAPFKHHEGKQ